MANSQRKIQLADADTEKTKILELSKIFKAVIKTMLHSIKVNYLKINGKIEILRRKTIKRNPMEILELKYKISEIKKKNTLDVLNSRIKMAEERFS